MGRSWQSRAAIALIVPAAALLRLWGVAGGAPFRMGADEPVVLSTALRIMRTGDFNPHFFDYGGLIFYLHAAAGCVAFLVGAMAGRWSALDQIWEGDLLVAGRLISVVLGTATVYVVYRAALRWGPRVAVVAALTMAVLPQAVRESHFALTDTPLTFFAALTLLLSLRAAESGRLGSFVLAGAAAGACAATKYNGLLAAIMPLAAATHLADGRQPARAAAALGGTALAFLCGSPYAVIDLPHFLDGFAALMQHYNRTRPFDESATTYFKYLRNWFTWQGVTPLWLGWMGLVTAGAGLVLSVLQLRHRTSRAATLTLVIFPLWYFWMIARQGALQYGRYLLPAAPMLAILFAIGAAGWDERLRAARRPAVRWAAVLPILLLALPLGSSIAWARAQSRTQTTELAAEWLVLHVTPGMSVAVEGASVQLPPRIQAIVVPRLFDRSLDDYRRLGIAYLVSSSSVSDKYLMAPAQHGADVAAHQRLFASAPLVHALTPSGEHPGPAMAILRVPE
jgi:4-amino-4-deoxy-L-arabinose transferase-like glycosyltransferase